MPVVVVEVMHSGTGGGSGGVQMVVVLAGNNRSRSGCGINL